MEALHYSWAGVIQQPHNIPITNLEASDLDRLGDLYGWRVNAGDAAQAFVFSENVLQPSTQVGAYINHTSSVASRPALPRCLELRGPQFLL